MDCTDALILGIVQGLTEYLPVSSSGHLEIFHQILGLNTTGAESLQFDIVLHVATVLSTIVILWREFSGLCVSFFTLRNDENTRTVIKILISCIPVGIVGLLFKDYVSDFFGGRLDIIGVCLCITALLLGFAYFTRTAPIWKPRNGVISGQKGRDISYFDAFVIGCAQAVAVLPGLSRSGSTIATGILLGDKRDKLASFSFIMVIIPILGEALLGIVGGLTGHKEFDAGVGVLPCLVGFVTAFVFGCLACKWMINIVRKGGLIWFALYCAIVGILSLFWFYGAIAH